MTPVRPLAPDAMLNVWHSEFSGTYEWMCGWKIAHELLNGGMTSINGLPCSVSVVGEWPEIRAIQVRATCEGMERAGAYDWEEENHPETWPRRLLKVMRMAA